MQIKKFPQDEVVTINRSSTKRLPKGVKPVHSSKAFQNRTSRKIYGVFEIYENSAISGVMNWFAAFAFILGSILVVWSEINYSEEVFSETETMMAKSEFLNDKLSVHNRVAYGDLVLPEQEMGGELIAEGALVLGEATGEGESTDYLVQETSQQETDIGPDERAGDEQPGTETIVSEQDQEGDVQALLDKIDDAEVANLIKLIGLAYEQITDDSTPEIEFSYADNVQLAVDGGVYSTITSPHTLAELELGSHTLAFKVDTDEAVEEFSVEMFVTPQLPEINPVEKEDITASGIVTISGTASSKAYVRVFVSSGIQNGEVQADTEGKWEYQPDYALDSGKHSVMAQSVVDGYVSEMTDPVEFTVEVEDLTSLPETGVTGLDLSVNTLLIVIGAMIAGIVMTIIWMKIFVIEREPELHISAGNGDGNGSHIKEAAREFKVRKDKKKQGLAVTKPVTKKDMSEKDSIEQTESTDVAGPVSSSGPVSGPGPFSPVGGEQTDGSAPSKQKPKRKKTISREEFLTAYKKADVDLDDKRTRRTKSSVGVSLL